MRPEQIARVAHEACRELDYVAAREGGPEAPEAWDELDTAARMEIIGLTTGLLSGGEAFASGGWPYRADEEVSRRVFRAVATALAGIAGNPQPAALLYQTRPQVGDRVHYVSFGTPGGEYPSTCRAAVITEVRDGQIIPEPGVPYADLCIFNPGGLFFCQGSRYDAGLYDGGERTFVPSQAMPLIACDDLKFGGGTWHWSGA